MDWLTVIIVGVVQGITEFLPISSDGHLLIAEALLEKFSGIHLEDPLTLNVALHGGTLLSILVVYWNRIWRLLGSDRRVIGLVVAGTIPAVVVGLPLKWYCEPVLESTLLAGLMLPVTGILLWTSGRTTPGNTDYVNLTYRQAVLIGAAQAFAILPGASRSGSTIATALFLGVAPEAAATFSFLLALPAVAGACVLVLHDATQNEISTIPWFHLGVGAFISFVTGVVALSWLRSWLQKGRFYQFAYWCIPVGIAVVVWQLWPASA
ncbi:MAG: undecaprenyl-diphosphate phosphatase [Pirellulales bacterium]|nr:undecaprenyl-diphosphate phosphatase [Pirellulales bacterium]